MQNTDSILQLLTDSPSNKLLTMRNREMVFRIFLNEFDDLKRVVKANDFQAMVKQHLTSIGFMADKLVGISVKDSYQTKARKFISFWLSDNLLCEFKNEEEQSCYKLACDTEIASSLLADIRKHNQSEKEDGENYSSLEHLLERTQLHLREENGVQNRTKTASRKKEELTIQLDKIATKVRELLFDFNQVEHGLIEITKRIHHKFNHRHNTKAEVLEYAFSAMEELNGSVHGSSFQAFWNYVLTPNLEQRWERVLRELYDSFDEKQGNETFRYLKDVEKLLFLAAQRVSKANDKLVERLCRLIRNENPSRARALKKELAEIKHLLIELSGDKAEVETSLALPEDIELATLIDRPLTFAPKNEDDEYEVQPSNALHDLMYSDQMIKLFSKSSVDSKRIEKEIQEALQQTDRITITEIISQNGGITKGLPEVMTYIGMAKKFKHHFEPSKHHSILFNKEKQKMIQIPEIIVMS